MTGLRSSAYDVLLAGATEELLDEYAHLPAVLVISRIVNAKRQTERVHELFGIELSTPAQHVAQIVGIARQTLPRNDIEV